MQCPKCGTNNTIGVKFCVNCGSSMGTFCPNCGTANLAGAKFCVHCGSQLGVTVAATSQPVVVVRTGIPGWVWAFIGILVGILIIGGLIISGILPFGAAPTEQASPPLQPVLESPEASTEAVNCPETGGVILYWNAGFDCSNDSGDPGYRLRYGDGFQDLNTGQFDDQASSIHIPEGWSVRLYENVEKNGASHCFNTSISNFEDLGNFDNRDLPINDNVTSMEVFRDGTCGQDLAAGAEPASMPKDEIPPIPPGGDAMGVQGGVCDCNCVRARFADLDITDWWNISSEVFFEKYEDPNFEGEVMELMNPNGLFDILVGNPNISLDIDYWDENEIWLGGSATIPNQLQDKLSCWHEEDEVHCYPDDFNFIPPGFNYHSHVSIWFVSGEEHIEQCINIKPSDDFRLFGLDPQDGNGNDVPRDCRDPLVSCPDNSTCVQSRETGLFYCEEIKTVDEPPTEAPSDSSSGGSSGSGGSPCGGSICEPPSSP